MSAGDEQAPLGRAVQPSQASQDRLSSVALSPAADVLSSHLVTITSSSRPRLRSFVFLSSHEPTHRPRLRVRRPDDPAAITANFPALCRGLLRPLPVPELSIPPVPLRHPCPGSSTHTLLSLLPRHAPRLPRCSSRSQMASTALRPRVHRELTPRLIAPPLTIDDAKRRDLIQSIIDDLSKPGANGGKKSRLSSKGAFALAFSSLQDASRPRDQMLPWLSRL